MSDVNRRVRPGFRLSLGYSIAYLSLLVLIPLVACFIKASELSFHDFVAAVWTERARSAYALTFATSLVAALVNIVIGSIVAWTLVRYEFPGKRIVDALFDYVNIVAVSPVVVFDTSRIGPNAVRHSAGGGIRFTMVSTVSFTMGWATNLGRQPGESRGAFFFSTEFRDLFR